MNGFIFGFQRFVWWPKWTPASSSSGTSSIVFDIGKGRRPNRRSGWRRCYTRPALATSISLRNASVLPAGIAIGDELLQHRETDFAVIQAVAEIAPFEDPGGRNPAQRQAGKLLDMVGPARTGICEDGDVRLLRDLVFREHGAAVFA